MNPLIIMAWCVFTVGCYYIGRFGGEYQQHLPLKHYKWYGPLLLVTLWGWITILL